MAEAARYFDRICDEMIDLEVLADSERPFIAALGRCLRRYRELLLATNAADFRPPAGVGVAGDVGKKVRVKVSFTDDRDNTKGPAHQ